MMADVQPSSSGRPPRSLVDYRDPPTVEAFIAEAERREQVLPVLFEVDQMVEWFVGRGSAISVDEIEVAAARVGRNSGPQLIRLLYVNQLLVGDALAYGVADAWSGTEFPMNALTRSDWLELLSATGYTIDGVASDRPSEPVLLYRGSLHPQRRRWSWTPDPIQAHWFADRPHVQGSVYEALVPPAALLMQFTKSPDAYRGEEEYVVNTRGIHIAAHRCSCWA